jgi:hypothetical protein
MGDQPLGTPDHLFDDTWRRMNDELSGESDRAAAIVGCALLDARLAELLSEFLIENEDGRSDLLNSEDANAPLGSFGSRIIAAYAVGLIDQPERDALRRLKKIRNRFAHSPLCVDFTDQAISAHSEAAHKLCPTTNYTGRPRGPRELFQGTVALLAGRIAERRYWITTSRLKGTFHSVRQAALAAGRGGGNVSGRGHR